MKKDYFTKACKKQKIEFKISSKKMSKIQKKTWISTKDYKTNAHFCQRNAKNVISVKGLKEKEKSEFHQKIEK